MICPRCGNEWDVTKSPCKRCGLLVRMSRTGPGIAPGPENESKRSFVAQQAEERTAFPDFARSDDPFRAQNPLMPQFEPEPRAPRQSFEVQAPLPSLDHGVRFASGSHLPPLPDVPPPSTDRGAPYVSGALRSGGLPDLRGSQEPLPASQLGLPLRPQMQSPARPQALPPGDRLTPAIPRPNRLVSSVADQHAYDAHSGSHFSSSESGEVTPRGEAEPHTNMTEPLAPGTVLRNGRYRLHEVLSRQEWKPGTFEVTWVAQDAQRGRTPVLLREVVIAEGRESAQSILRSATVSLMAAGQLPRVPSLWDAFTENGRNFFCFEPIEGNSLMTRMRRLGRPMPEQEVLDCCLQIAEVLEALSAQKQPVVHGMIRPEDIIISRNGQYVLTGFSVVQAGSGGLYGASLDRAKLPPYAAPEVGNGLIDTRSDLYSLLATAYHVVTGSAPVRDGSIDGVPPVRRLNPSLSAQLEAVLARGLRPNVAQRYRSASELKQELSAWKGGPQMPMGAIVSASGASFTSVAPVAFSGGFQSASGDSPDSVAQMLPNMLISSVDEDESKALLPRPEDLPPMVERNDRLHSALWFIGIVACLLFVVLISRGM